MASRQIRTYAGAKVGKGLSKAVLDLPSNTWIGHFEMSYSTVSNLDGGSDVAEGVVSMGL